MMKTFAVNIRIDSGKYVTLTILAYSAHDAGIAAVEMAGGGTVNYVRQLD